MILLTQIPKTFSLKALPNPKMDLKCTQGGEAALDQEKMNSIHPVLLNQYHYLHSIRDANSGDGHVLPLYDTSVFCLLYSKKIEKNVRQILSSEITENGIFKLIIDYIFVHGNYVFRWKELKPHIQHESLTNDLRNFSDLSQAVGDLDLLTFPLETRTIFCDKQQNQIFYPTKECRRDFWFYEFRSHHLWPHSGKKDPSFLQVDDLFLPIKKGTTKGGSRCDLSLWIICHSGAGVDRQFLSPRMYFLLFMPPRSPKARVTDSLLERIMSVYYELLEIGMRTRAFS